MFIIINVTFYLSICKHKVLDPLHISGNVGSTLFAYNNYVCDPFVRCNIVQKPAIVQLTRYTYDKT